MIDLLTGGATVTHYFWMGGLEGCSGPVWFMLRDTRTDTHLTYRTKVRYKATRLYFWLPNFVRRNGEGWVCSLCVLFITSVFLFGLLVCVCVCVCVVSIKCRFDQFRSTLSIKCRFDQVSFRSSVVSIKCPFEHL